MIFASLFIALACLVRYAGIASIASGILMLLLFHRKHFVQRVKDSVIFFVLSFSPLGLWFLRNFNVDPDRASEARYFHLPALTYFNRAFNTLTTWILPDEFPEALRSVTFILILTALVIALILTLSRRLKNETIKDLAGDGPMRFIAAMAFFVICNAVLLFAHLCLVNVNTQANDRHFSHYYVACLIGAFILLSAYLKSCQNPKIIKMVLLIAGVGLSSSYLFTAGKNFSDMYQNGEGFSQRKWRTSPTIAQIKTWPKSVFIYSNEPSLIYINTGRPVSRLPRKYNKMHSRSEGTGELGENKLSELNRVAERLKASRGYIVYFNKRHRWYNFSQEELQERLPIQVVESFKDGEIYQIRLPSSNP